MRILLVEDNPDDREIALRAFGRVSSEHEIVLAEDGQVGLDMILDGAGDPSAEPDLVLLDLSMPRVDGLEFMERVRFSDEHRSLPIIMFTTSSDPVDVRRAYAAGCNAYIVKPYSVQGLTQVFESLTRFWSLVTRERKRHSN